LRCDRIALISVRALGPSVYQNYRDEISANALPITSGRKVLPALSQVNLELWYLSRDRSGRLNFSAAQQIDQLSGLAVVANAHYIAIDLMQGFRHRVGIVT
jgi:hypothetical protein